MVVNELSRVLYGEQDVTERDVRQWFDLPGVEMRVAARPDGRIVGYVDVSGQAEQSRFWIDLRVPPGADAADVAAALLDAAEELAGGAAPVRAFVPSVYELGAAVLQERGYAIVRHSFQMRIELERELTPPRWPDGIAVRPFEPGRDDEAVYEAHQEAWEEQFDFVRQSYDEWRTWTFLEPHDPSLWFLAVDGDAIAGICLCRPEWAADRDLGWVSILGVRPPWRRRGLGLALLLHGFAELRARGKLRVGLGVDGLNPTGAVRLYERAGMYVVRRFDTYQRPLSQ